MSRISLEAIVDEAPIIAILRRPKVDPVRCIEQLFQTGIRLIEITMDTSSAVEVLESQRSRVPANALLGAGTVTDVARAEAALAAGAAFLVTPNLDFDVIRIAREQDIPIVPGAMTPTEIWNAARAGAELVKVFPASTLGPGYFRELRGPFAKLSLMASGGINVDNAHDFIASGVDAVGVGGALIPKTDDEFERCAEIARRLLEITRKARPSR
jgi:2-dehydro-3-deoxyphosphogluconate aldolase / (4S)-4-hydroxy-2-oxoglutarate aldolase